MPAIIDDVETGRRRQENVLARRIYPMSSAEPMKHQNSRAGRMSPPQLKRRRV
jgi:hypothetical protein